MESGGGEGGARRKDKIRKEKVPQEATSRQSTICVLFLVFKLAKIIQKLNQYVRGESRKGSLFSAVSGNLCVCVCVCDDSVNLFSFYKLSFVLLQTRV